MLLQNSGKEDSLAATGLSWGCVDLGLDLKAASNACIRERYVVPFGLEAKDIIIPIINAVITALLIGVAVFYFQTFIQENLKMQSKQNEMNREVAEKIFGFTESVGTACIEMHKAIEQYDKSDKLESNKKSCIKILQEQYDVEREAIQQLVMYRDMHYKAFGEYKEEIDESQEAINDFSKVIEDAKINNQGKVGLQDFNLAQRKVLDVSMELANKCSEKMYFTAQ